MIVDVHNHLGTSPFDVCGDLSELLQMMDQAGIDRSVIFTIDEPDRDEVYTKQNDMIASAVKKHPDRLMGVCRTRPQAGDAAIAEMKRCKEQGLIGLKLHPKSDQFGPEDCGGVLKCASDLNWPVILHSEHHSSSKPSSWRKNFNDFAQVNFILTHGGKDDWAEAAEIAKACPNVYLETSTLSYNRTKMLLDRAGFEKIIFGSDYPYSHPYLEVKKYELLIPDPKNREIVFLKNFQKLFSL